MRHAVLFHAKLVGELASTVSDAIALVVLGSSFLRPLSGNIVGP